MKIKNIFLIIAAAAAYVMAGVGEISLGAHYNKGTGANIGYTRILDSKWLWAIGLDYGLMDLNVMDSESSKIIYETNAMVGMIEYKFEIGKVFSINPTLSWKLLGGIGGALLDGTLDGMPGKDRSMWSLPVEVHLVRYTDETKDFGFFSGFNLTFRMAQNSELYEEFNVISPQIRGGIVF